MNVHPAHPLALLAALVLCSPPARSAVVIATVNSPGGGVPELVYSTDVSSSDLLHGLVGVPSGTWNGGGAAWLNNGVHGDSFNNIGAPAASQIAWPQVNSNVTYNLGLGSGLGYDITSVQSIAAWQSAGFGNQGYTLEVQPVGGSFSPLTTVLYNPFNNAAGATRVTLTDDGTGPNGILATGIEAIRFTHNSVPLSNSGRVTYRELDVFGTATTAVPEPSRALLLGLAGALLLLRRRR